jgi:hypothetical protein
VVTLDAAIEPAEVAAVLARFECLEEERFARCIVADSET